jgi:hypothetical protein
MLGWVLGVAVCGSVDAALVPITRFSVIDMSLTAGTQSRSGHREETTFADFDQIVIDSASVPGSSASANASQRSSVANASGGFTVSGGTATATIAATASGLSHFTSQFSTDITGIHRFSGAIGRTGTGQVTAYLRDLSSPADVFLLRREVNPTNNDPGETWIEDFNLSTGHTYELFVEARAGGTTIGSLDGTTSYTILLNPVPEPTSPAILGTALMALLARRGRKPEATGLCHPEKL